jgi:hypothetical protein
VFIRNWMVLVFSWGMMLVPGSAFGQGSVAASAVRATPDASKNDQIVRQVMKLNEEMVAAQVRGDAVAIEKFLADDYSKMHEVGAVQTRAEFLKDNFPGRYLAIDLSDVTGRVYGSTVILMGHTRTKRARNETRTSFTDVWVEQNGTWKVVMWATVGQVPVDAAAPSAANRPGK